MNAQDVLLAIATIIALAGAWFFFFQGGCPVCGESAAKNVSLSQCLRALEINPACFTQDGSWNSSGIPKQMPDYCIEYNQKFEPKILSCGQPPQYPHGG